MRTAAWVIAGAGLALLAAGCGSGTDPLGAIGGTDLVSLQLPSSPITFVTYAAPYSASTAPYASWTISPTGSVVAPQAGFVDSIDTTVGNGSVTIFHNSRMKSKISRLNSVSVQVGRFVQKNEVIGTPSSLYSYIITMTLTVDGKTVCPEAYLEPASLLQLGSTAHCNY